jgi:hypothetical protein
MCKWQELQDTKDYFSLGIMFTKWSLWYNVTEIMHKIIMKENK